MAYDLREYVWDCMSMISCKIIIIIIMSKSEYFVNLPKCYIIRISFNQYNTISLCARSFKHHSAAHIIGLVCRHKERYFFCIISQISFHLLRQQQQYICTNNFTPNFAHITTIKKWRRKTRHYTSKDHDNTVHLAATRRKTLNNRLNDRMHI